jgi:hypothetical protein
MRSSPCYKAFLPCVALAGLLALQGGCDTKPLTQALTSVAASGGENAQQQKIHSINNLKYVGLAIHTYAQYAKGFPPAYVADRNGKPLLSWRVLILPYMGQEGLYAQFHLDEPWDSENNKKLIALMPDVYKAPGSAVADQWKTNYLAVRGDDSVMSGATPNKFSSVRDGLSRTIMTVEVSDARAVEWTRPDDFQYNPQNPMDGLAGLREGCFIVGLADCSVRALKLSKSPEVLRGWFSKNDRSTVSVDDDAPDSGMPGVPFGL